MLSVLPQLAPMLSASIRFTPFRSDTYSSEFVYAKLFIIFHWKLFIYAQVVVNQLPLKHVRKIR